MNVLGIETSCDETGVALVDAGSIGVPRLRAQALHTQAAMHEAYGGVVPELASRDHIRRVLPLARQVLAEAGAGLADIDLVAYTRGPGLAGALLVGAGIAVALAAALRRPVFGVHHLEGHLLSPFLSADPPAFPFVALLVSGGHTQLMRVDDVGRYTLLGETIDDAAGDAFDLPRPLLHKPNLDFSFAGLKTAVAVKLAGAAPTDAQRADMAASVQHAIVDVLCAQAVRALEQNGLDRLVVAGGVGANAALRERLGAACARRGASVHYPELESCTDNGAMIALAAAMRWQRGRLEAQREPSFDVRPRWPLETA